MWRFKIIEVDDEGIFLTEEEESSISGLFDLSSHAADQADLIMHMRDRVEELV